MEILREMFIRPFRKSSISELHGTAILFLQAFTFQILFYPIIILNIIRHPGQLAGSQKIVGGFLLILLAAISISIRGGSYELIVALLRFYCGIILVSAAFILNKNLKLSRLAMWIFVLFVFYEFLCLRFGLTPLSYANFVNSGIMDEIGGRVLISENSVRALGPSMNSSISGSILAIMIFFVLSRGNQLTTPRSIALLLSLFAAFVLCGSTSAMATFVFLLAAHVFSRRKLRNRVSKKRYIARVFLIFSFVLPSVLFATYVEDGFYDALFTSKWNIDYLLFGLNYKLFQTEVFENIQMIFLGANLADAKLESTGGDFILLSFVYHFGIVFVIAFLAYLIFICRRENRVFLLAGMLSSLHYGTLFSLTGQAFFGAIIAGSLYADSRSIKIHARPKLSEQHYN